MEFFTDERDARICSRRASRPRSSARTGFDDVGSGPGSTEARYIDWLTIADSEQSVVDDVSRIRDASARAGAGSRSTATSTT